MVFPKMFRKLVARQNVEVPSVCYDECNDAIIDAERVGKSPALCDASSPFSTQLESCSSCIAAHSGNSTAYNSVDTLPQFEQFISYCDSLSGGTTGRFQSIQSLLEQASALASSQSALNGELSSLGYLPSSSVASATDATTTHATTTQANAAPARTTLYRTGISTSSPSPSSSESSKSDSHASVIAPAVVVPVAAVIFILLAIAFILRRRKQKTAGQHSLTEGSYEDKPQLHSDDLKLELDPRTTVPAADKITTSEAPTHGIFELPARELVGSEMDTEGRQSSTHSR